MRLRYFPVFCLAIVLALSGCQSKTVEPEATPTVIAEVPTVELPTATPTSVPERTLTICLEQEPDTLYLYGGSSQSMWSVLEAVYDGPIDTLGYTAQPVILTKLPSLQDGDAVLHPIEVQAGDLVIDAAGDLVALTSGVSVLPSGCSSQECAVTWDGSSALSMDQLEVRFILRPDILWSDGTPLTAADSAYSYRISNDPNTPVSQDILNRTFFYGAGNDNTIQWVGIPGYYPARYETLFWSPLPRHILEQYNASDLLTAEESSRTPLGWGPYIVEEWVDGDHISLRKNTNYFRAAEGLPAFDRLVFHFTNNPGDGNLESLLAGECDVLDWNTGLDEQVQSVREHELKQEIKLYSGQGPEWEQMVFGIKPAAYDTPTYETYAQRPDFFANAQVRQAFAYCMDRQRIVDDILFGFSSIPNSYLPPEHPYYMSDLAVIPFDPQTGSQLLDQAGWRDLDADPSTPRTSLGVANVVDGTPFVIEYATTGARLRQEAVQILTESLAECSIQLNRQNVQPTDLFIPGPNGEIFGRSFDVVQLAWQAGAEPPCRLYTTEQIPSKANDWVGVNVAGYSNADFDSACSSALSTRPDQQAERLAYHQQAQTIFAQDLPAIPLYFRLRVAASRPDLCGVQLDVSARSLLWNLETYDINEACRTPAQ